LVAVGQVRCGCCTSMLHALISSLPAVSWMVRAGRAASQTSGANALTRTNVKDGSHSGTRDMIMLLSGAPAFQALAL
jgi:hypothetical protein